MERTQKSCSPCLVKEGKTGIMISEYWSIPSCSLR
ncbi:hypothetical protein V6Z11_D06G167700 [Gossypium hirsutum]